MYNKKREVRDTIENKKIYIMECTQEEAEDIYDECLDLIESGAITWESFSGSFTDIRNIRIELKDVESWSITHNDAGTTIELVTADYIMMHDIETANEVRCLV